MPELSVARLVEEKGESFQLEVLTKSWRHGQPITVSDVNRPGLALAGFSENFLSERIQILGETEMLFLETLSEPERHRAIDRLLALDIPCLIIAKDLEYDAYLMNEADRLGVPVLRTPQSTTPFIHGLTEYLDQYFAPRTSIHGTLVDVYGVGLLITGSAGIGKSELALDLIERGHRLVADDLIIVTRRHNLLYGEPPDRLKYLMEIRGIGIVDVRRLFGIRAVGKNKRIDVELSLREWKADVRYDRKHMQERVASLVGLEFPVVTIPLIPGKNVTVLAEVVAMNHQLKVQGIRTEQELNDRVLRENLESAHPDDNAGDRNA